MQTISINGVELQVPDGASVSIVNGVVQINNNTVHNLGNANIVIGSQGSKFTIHCDKDVTIDGDVAGGVKAKGNVSCRNVTGGIEANEVKCGNVTGGIEANGNVVCNGNVTGGIEAGNFSRG